MEEPERRAHLSLGNSQKRTGGREDDAHKRSPITKENLRKLNSTLGERLYLLDPIL